MRSILLGLEGSALGVFVRESGVWTYAFLNLFHILGVSTLFGSILVLDLRLLGMARMLRIGDLARFTVPLSQVGFVLAAGTGVMMLSTNGSEYIGNPYLPAKFAAIATGLLNVAIVSRLEAWRAARFRDLSAAERRTLGFAGAASLASWLTAVVCGRMIGYW